MNATKRSQFDLARQLAQLALLFACWVSVSGSWPVAAIGQQTLPDKHVGDPATWDRLRLIYLPYEELPAVLSSPQERILVDRDEVIRLLGEHPQVEAPGYDLATWRSAEYNIQLEGSVATLTGNITFESLQRRPTAVKLPWQGLTVQSLMINGQPPVIYRQPDGQLMWLVREPGSYRLELTGQFPIRVDGERQSFGLKLAEVSTNRISLNVPGNVELLDGPAVLQRQYDADTNQTRFELSPTSAELRLTLSLNNRNREQSLLWSLRQINLIDLSESNDRLAMVWEPRVMRGQLDEIRCPVPTGLEIMEVRGQSVRSWEIRDRDTQPQLVIQLHTTFAAAPIQLVGLRNRPAPINESAQNWQFPMFEVSGTAYQPRLTVVQAPAELWLAQPESTGLFAVDLPQTRELLQAAAASTETIRDLLKSDNLQMAFYSTADAPQLELAVRHSPATIGAVGTHICEFTESRWQSTSAFQISRSGDAVFDVSFALQPGTRVLSVQSPTGPLPYRLQVLDGLQNLHLELPQGIDDSAPLSLVIDLEYIPENWFGTWTQFQHAFRPPHPVGIERVKGVVAIKLGPQFSAESIEAEGMQPLSREDLSRYRLGQLEPTVAYGFDSKQPAITLGLSRNQAQVLADCVCFYKFEPTRIAVHGEINLEIRGTATKRFAVKLPNNAPDTIAFSCSSDNQVIERQRRANTTDVIWEVTLAREVLGPTQLFVDFEVPSTSQTTTHELQGIQIVDADLQTIAASVEGSAELDVSIRRELPRLPVDDLPNTLYRPGRHLAGVVDLTNQSAVPQVSTQLRASENTPAAVVEVAQLAAGLARDGSGQFFHTYFLKTSHPKLYLELPAGAEIWSLAINDIPQTAKQADGRIALAFTSGDGSQLQSIEISYQGEVGINPQTGRFELTAPRLLVPAAGNSPEREVPILKSAWSVSPPPGMQVIDPQGTWLTSQPLVTSTTWAQRQGQWLKEAWDRIRPALERIDFASLSPQTRWERAVTQKGVTSEAGELDSIRPSEPGRFFDQAAGAVPVAARESQAVDPSLLARDAEAKKELSDQPAVIAPPNNAPMAPPSDNRKANLNTLAIRSLNIEHRAITTATTFQALGAKPQIELALVNPIWQQGFSAIVIIVTLAISLITLACSMRAKLWLLFALLAISLSAVWLQPIWPQLSETLEWLIWIPVGLLLLHALWTGIYRLTGRVFRIFRRRAVAVAAVLLLTLVTNPVQLTHAQEIPQVPVATLPNIQASELPTYVIDPSLLMSPTLTLDERAVLIPYDVKNPESAAQQKWLFSKRWYDELTKIKSVKRPVVLPLPQSLLLPSTTWEAARRSSTSIRFTTRTQLELPNDQWRRIPLNTDRGVIVSVALDDEPVAVNSNPGPAQDPAQSALESGPYILVRGPGRPQLTLVMDFPLEQRPGGWTVTGRLPASGAAQVSLDQQGARGEWIWISRELQIAKELTENGEGRLPPLALADDGQFRLTYREPAMRSNQAHENSATWRHQVLVRSQQLHWISAVNLQWIEATNRVEIEFPEAVIIEQAQCENLKNWNVDPQNPRRYQFEFLAPVTQEKMQFEFTWRQSNAEPELSAFPLTQPQAIDMAVVAGSLEIYRSRQVELTADHLLHMNRTDFDTSSPPPSVWAAWSQVDTVLPFQRFMFDHRDAQLDLTLSRLAQTWNAKHFTLLDADLAQTRFESRILIEPQGIGGHDLTFIAPAGLELESLLVTPVAGSAKAVATNQVDKQVQEDGSVRWHLRFQSRQSQPFAIVTLGVLPRTVDAALTYRPLVVEQASQQRYEYALLTGEALTATLADETGIDRRLPADMANWLQPDHRSKTKHAWAAETSAHSLTIRTQRLPAIVQFESISDATITNRAIEHTLLLEWNINRAGIDQVEFVLPRVWKTCKIDGPWIRRIARRDLENDQTQFTVFLQDRILGDYRLALTLDQPLQSDNQMVVLPINLTGTTRDRFVTLQNSSRNQLNFTPDNGLETLNRQTPQFRSLEQKLAAVFVTQAYSAKSTVGTATLTWQSAPRSEIETVTASAKISLTDLVIDRSGHYIAKQSIMLNNRTEPVLEIELPANAQLLNVNVDGIPTSPLRQVNANRNVIAIPLLKSTELNLDYPLIILYSGQIPNFVTIQEQTMPLAATVNIQTELSHVRLHVPPSLRPLQFAGTMTQVTTQQELFSEVQSYQEQVLANFRNSLDLKGGVDLVSKLDDAERVKELFLGFNSNFASALDGNAAQLTDQKPESNGYVQLGNKQLLDSLQRIVDQENEMAQQQANLQELSSNRGRIQSRVMDQSNRNEQSQMAKQMSNFIAEPNTELTKPDVAGKVVELDKGDDRFQVDALAQEKLKNAFKQQMNQQGQGFDEQVEDQIASQNALILGQKNSLPRLPGASDKDVVDGNLADFESSRQEVGAELGEQSRPRSGGDGQLAGDPLALGGNARGFGGGGGGFGAPPAPPSGGGQGASGSLREESKSRVAMPSPSSGLSAGRVGGGAGGEREQRQSSAESNAEPMRRIAVQGLETRNPGLKIDFTAQGTTYYFRVPRGNPQLTAQFVDERQYAQLWSSLQIGGVLLGVGILLLGFRRRTN